MTMTNIANIMTEEEQENIDPVEASKDKLQALMKELKANKTLKGARIYLGSDPEVRPEFISFGIPELDKLCRGILRGGYTIFYGGEKAGKSSCMLRAIRSMQEAGLAPALFDLEERFDPEWAKVQGVDLNNLTVIQGATDLEEALTIAETGVKSGLFTALAIDSITAKSARGELQDKAGKDRTLDEDTMAAMARLLSKWFRRATSSIKAKRIPVLMLAQVRTSNINSGAFLDITGGLALKHYASTVVRIGRADKISMTKSGTKKDLGFWMKAELKKTSLCVNEGQEVRIPFYFGVGIDDIAAAVRAGINTGAVINLPTKGIEFNGKKYASEPAFVERLRDSEELLAELLENVQDASGDALDTLADSGHHPPSKNAPETILERLEAPFEGVNDSEIACPACGRLCKSAGGLAIHQTRAHKEA